MAEIHIDTTKPLGHNIYPDGHLCQVEREQHRTILHFDAIDWSATIEFSDEEIQVLTAAHQLLEHYPTIRKVTT